MYLFDSEVVFFTFFFTKIKKLLLYKKDDRWKNFDTKKRPLEFSNGSTAAARAFHKLLGNVLATPRISSNVFRVEQLFAF